MEKGKHINEMERGERCELLHSLSVRIALLSWVNNVLKRCTLGDYVIVHTTL